MNILLDLANSLDKHGFFKASKLIITAAEIDTAKYPEVGMAKLLIKTNFNDMRSAVRNSPYSVIIFTLKQAKVRDIIITYAEGRAFNKNMPMDLATAQIVFDRTKKALQPNQIILLCENNGSVKAAEPESNMHIFKIFADQRVNVEQDPDQVIQRITAPVRYKNAPSEELRVSRPRTDDVALTPPKRPGAFKFDTIFNWAYESVPVKFDVPTAKGQTGAMMKRKFKVIDWIWDGNKWLTESEFTKQFGPRNMADTAEVHDGTTWLSKNQFDAKYGNNVKKNKPHWKAEPTPKSEYKEKLDRAIEERGAKQIKRFDDNGKPLPPRVKTRERHEYNRVPKGNAPRHSELFEAAPSGHFGDAPESAWGRREIEKPEEADDESSVGGLTRQNSGNRSPTLNTNIHSTTWKSPEERAKLNRSKK